MGSLRWVAVGMIVVALDLRVDGLDLVPDPLGYAAVWAGLGSHTARHRGFVVAVAALVPGERSLARLVGAGDVVLLAMTLLALAGAAATSGAQDLTVVAVGLLVLALAVYGGFLWRLFRAADAEPDAVSLLQ